MRVRGGLGCTSDVVGVRVRVRDGLGCTSAVVGVRVRVRDGLGCTSYVVGVRVRVRDGLGSPVSVSYTPLRDNVTLLYLVCRFLAENKKLL